jgi:hypothetical protein
MWKPSSRPERLFWQITGWRWLVLPLGVVLIAVGAALLPRLTRDTTADAFIRPDDPARIYRERVEEVFGLKDPIAVAVIHPEPPGVFNPDTLKLVAWLTERIASLPNVDPDRVTSLATERNVVGTPDGMEVEEFYDAPPDEPGRAEWLARAIADFPLYQGSLVSRDGTATLVVAELLDESRSTETYAAILKLVETSPRGPGDGIHVAGEGAVSGYLATYIDRDARRLNPIAALMITVILFLAFRTLAGTLLPNLIVLATVAIAFGTMAAAGVNFFVITNGLIAALIGIAVADSIHLFSAYYERAAAQPRDSQRVLVVQAFTAMWRPVTLTSLTTIAGFLALWPTTTMPPLQYFGLFGALGVGVAWFYTMTFLPALLTVFPKRTSRLFPAATPAQRMHDPVGFGMEALGALVLRHPALFAFGGLALVGLGAVGAARVEVNEARIENFLPSEPIYQADKRINAVMDGTYHLDVLVDAGGVDGLFAPEVLRRIERLQRFLEDLPGVGGTTSVADYVKQMHRAVSEGRAEAYVIPDDPQLIAQLFKLYEASGDPTDFEEEMDYEHRRALVRASVNQGIFSNDRTLVEATEPYLAEAFGNDGTRASLTGRLHVDYHWIRGIRESALLSIAVSGLAVLIMSMALFRSVAAGVLAAAPVGLAILLVYGVMGFTGIWLGVGTAMFAAIAIGLGVDFGIHAVDQVREFTRQRDGDLESGLRAFFRTTSRALFFNFAAVALGFGVLLTSDVPPLVRFGGLVGVAIGGAFLGAVTILPALIVLTRPRFFTGAVAAAPAPARVPWKAVAGGLLIALIGAGVAAEVEELPDGRSLMEQVVARDEGEWVSRRIRLELEDRRGTKRVEETRSFRRYYGADKKSVIFYLEPTNVRDTAFLTYDYADPDRDDDQWLYLPALRKVRRISASNRGDSFLGTDLTYEEIKKENKVELADYQFSTKGKETVDGAECWVVESTPVDREVAKELGYSRVRSRVDPEIWMSRRVEYWDLNGNLLKTVHNEEIARVDGVWTVRRLSVENHKTGHRTRLAFSDVDYRTEVDDEMFEQRRLRRGM